MLIKKILFDPYIKNNMLIRLKNAKKLYATDNISRVILELENVKGHNNANNTNINNSNRLK